MKANPLAGLNDAFDLARDAADHAIAATCKAQKDASQTLRAAQEKLRDQSVDNDNDGKSIFLIW